MTSSIHAGPSPKLGEWLQGRVDDMLVDHLLESLLLPHTTSPLTSTTVSAIRCMYYLNAGPNERNAEKFVRGS